MGINWENLDLSSVNNKSLSKSDMPQKATTEREKQIINVFIDPFDNIKNTNSLENIFESNATQKYKYKVKAGENLTIIAKNLLKTMENIDANDPANIKLVKEAIIKDNPLGKGKNNLKNFNGVLGFWQNAEINVRIQISGSSILPKTSAQTQVNTKTPQKNSLPPTDSETPDITETVISNVAGEKESQSTVKIKNEVTNNQKNSLDIQNPFNEKTQALINQKNSHNTKLLNNAQNLLGIVEVSAAEFLKMTPEQRQKTQYAIIGKHGNINEQWCAHTVSFLCNKTGIKIGTYKKTVAQFIQWAKNKNNYHSISTKSMTPTNFSTERLKRATQIKNQLPNMHEGDFIVWKSDYIAKFKNEGLKATKSSHIGIIESVDTNKGTVTVIEGNANEFLSGSDFERETVQTKQQGRSGAQEIGEAREVNNRDGLIRKVYTISDLANYGYSGYINNQSIIV